MHKNKSVIFKYTNFRDYIQQYLDGSNRSYFQLARELGYKSPRSIGMIIKGQRHPSQTLVSRLSSHMKHSEKEHRYFELLVELDKATKKKSPPNIINAIQNDMKKLHKIYSTKKSPPTLEAKINLEWYLPAIKQLINSPGFKEDAIWISKKLKPSITQMQANHAIRELLKTKVLTRNSEGILQVVVDAITSADDVEDKNIKKYHAQMLNKAKEALTEQNIQKREFRSATLKIKPENLGRAKKDLRNFMNQFVKKYQTEDENSIYQFGMQLFSLSKD